MNFYQLLSEYYDDIFPVSDQKLRFFVDLFQAHEVQQVLDVACGSGLLARRLASKGYEVTGIDLEEKMIAQAQKRAAAEALSVRFLVGDMREVAKIGASFDSIVCIGNSLAHLLSENDIQRTLSGMYEATRPGGISIIQIVNFDRILASGPTELPDIVRKDKGFAFYRTYIPTDNQLVLFRSRFVTTKDSIDHVNEIQLRAIRKNELERMMLAAGFCNLQFFGGFDATPYSPESYATIVAAEKR